MKRMLSFLLVLAMLVCCMPVEALAAAGTASVKPPRLPQPEPMANMASTFAIGNTADGMGYTFSSFADLKELASRSYSDYTYAMYEGSSPLVIEEDLTMPAYLELCVWGVDVRIPQGVTFTATEYLSFDRLAVEGTACTANLNVYESLTVSGTLFNEGWIWIGAGARVTGTGSIVHTQEYSGISFGYYVTDTASLLEVINAYIAKIHADGTFEGWIDTAIAQNATLVQE